MLPNHGKAYTNSNYDLILQILHIKIKETSPFSNPPSNDRTGGSHQLARPLPRQNWTKSSSIMSAHTRAKVDNFGLPSSKD